MYFINLTISERQSPRNGIEIKGYQLMRILERKREDKCNHEKMA